MASFLCFKFGDGITPTNLVIHVIPSVPMGYPHGLQRGRFPELVRKTEGLRRLRCRLTRPTWIHFKSWKAPSDRPRY